MNYNYDHDRFVSKNKSLASGYSVNKHDADMEKKGFIHHERRDEASCFNCKIRSKCSEFRNRRTGGHAGAASFGGNEKFICDKFIPAPVSEKSMSDKQIKSLLKNIRKGRC